MKKIILLLAFLLTACDLTTKPDSGNTQGQTKKTTKLVYSSGAPMLEYEISNGNRQAGTSYLVGIKTEYYYYAPGYGGNIGAQSYYYGDNSVQEETARYVNWDSYWK